MEGPGKIKHSRPVPPFLRWCSATIPAAFDDSLTYYEALCSLWKWLQTNLVEVVNNNATVTQEYIALVDELKEFVDNYFENLDVQEEINNKLDEMVESGEFASIIGEYINDGFLNDNFYIYPVRKGRYLTKTIANPTYDETTDFNGMQGGCYVGSNHFIQATINNFAHLVQLRELNLQTGEVIRTNVLALQHANSITYDPNTNRLYVCSLTDSGVNTQYVYVLDYTTWNIIKTIDLSSQLQSTEGTHSISYDEKTGKIILGAELRSYNSMRFFELDADTEELTEISMTDSYGLLTGTGANNDITVYDSHLYLLKHNPNCISEWDLNTGKLIKVYNIPLITPEGWTQGECESITYSATEKIFYLGSYNPDCNGGYYWLNAFYTFDLLHNEPFNKQFSIVGDIVKTVYVDIDSTEWNPKGTSSSRFSTVGEALQLLNLPEIAGLVITMRNNKTYPYVNIYTEKTVVLTVDDVNTRNTVINGIAVEDSDNVYITALIVSGIGSHEFDIRVRRSNVEITAVRFGENHVTHIDTWHSKIRIFNVANDSGVTGALFNCRAENEVICLDATPKFEVIGNMPAINKPVKLATFTNPTSTHTEISCDNMNIAKIGNRLFAHANGLYFQQDAYFATQTSDGGNRNFTIILSNTLCEYQVIFDYTNSKLKLRLTKAINLEDGTDVTSSTNTTIDLYVAY